MVITILECNQLSKTPTENNPSGRFFISAIVNARYVVYLLLFCSFCLFNRYNIPCIHQAAILMS